MAAESLEPVTQRTPALGGRGALEALQGEMAPMRGFTANRLIKQIRTAAGR